MATVRVESKIQSSLKDMLDDITEILDAEQWRSSKFKKNKQKQTSPQNTQTEINGDQSKPYKVER